MTDQKLLDQFAMAAMQAIVSQARLNPCGDFVAGDCLLQHWKAPEYAASSAYQFAVAMMSERAKRMPAVAEPAKPDREPRRVWVNEYGCGIYGLKSICESEYEASRVQMPNRIACVEFVEVVR